MAAPGVIKHLGAATRAPTVGSRSSPKLLEIHLQGF